MTTVSKGEKVQLCFACSCFENIDFDTSGKTTVQLTLLFCKANKRCKISRYGKKCGCTVVFEFKVDCKEKRGNIDLEIGLWNVCLLNAEGVEICKKQQLFVKGQNKIFLDRAC